MDLAAKAEKPAKAHDQRAPFLRVNMCALGAGVLLQQPLLHMQPDDVHFKRVC